MANLEKIIKVTQEQYDILASGGRVGDYVGLQDDYIYMIEDENTYLPTTGGTITGNLTVNGNTTFKNNSTYTSGKGIEFLYNSGAYTGIGLSINCDILNNEIIYLGNDENGDPLYKPLFVNDGNDIIYSEDNNYNKSIAFNTGSLLITNHTDTQNYINISSYSGAIYYYNEEDSEQYSYEFPEKSGIIALTSDIPSVSLTTTAGSESITVGSNTLNIVTRDTAQTITGLKTFGSNGFKINNVVFNGGDANLNYARVGNLYMYTSGGMITYSYGVFAPGTSATYNLGNSTHLWQDLYLSRNLTDGTNSITVANIQEKVQVKRYI